jgi:oligopeptide/dipeptide ABC transporter ATP-binding protein
MREPAVIETRELRKHYPIGGGLFGRSRGVVRAVDGVSIRLETGRTLALVGESGCGKSTTAKLLLRLEHPTAGLIHFEGADLAEASPELLRRYRASVQAVFQDPWSSLNPRMRVRRIIGEPLILNASPSRDELRARVAENLEAVGLEPAMADYFPHEFSGGQRQRIAVSRALILRPKVIVLDEPTSALDVSIRTQIINLLGDLQARFGMSYLLISHDLATVRSQADRVAVMYLGEIVEQAPSEELFAAPRHPYTQALIAAARFVRPGQAVAVSTLPGDPPSPSAPPPGCRFSPRCPQAFERCFRESPRRRLVDDEHHVACHLYEGPERD